jgi:hypothetical protein
MGRPLEYPTYNYRFITNLAPCYLTNTLHLKHLPIHLPIQTMSTSQSSRRLGKVPQPQTPGAHIEDHDDNNHEELLS